MVVKTRGDEGFTIVEAIVSMAVLAIVAVLFVSTFIAMAGVSKENRDNTETDKTLNEAIITKELSGAGYQSSSLAPGAIIIGGQAIPYKAVRYTSTQNNRGFTVMEYDGK